MKKMLPEQLLPHRKPALLISKISELTPEQVTAEVVWERAEESPLIFIEAAAQSVAALLGCAEAEQGKAASEGFLVGVRDFQFPEKMPIGTWQVMVKSQKTLPPFYIFSAQIFCNQICHAQGTLTLYKPEA